MSNEDDYEDDANDFRRRKSPRGMKGYVFLPLLLIAMGMALVGGILLRDNLPVLSFLQKPSSPVYVPPPPSQMQMN